MLKDTIKADISDVEFGERKRQLIEHFQTRTTPKRPACVLSISIFANLHDFCCANPEEIQTVSIEIIGYVQTKGSRKFAMTPDTVCDLGARPQRLVQQQQLSC